MRLRHVSHRHREQARAHHAGPRAPGGDPRAIHEEDGERRTHHGGRPGEQPEVRRVQDVVILEVRQCRERSGKAPQHVIDAVQQEQKIRPQRRLVEVPRIDVPRPDLDCLVYGRRLVGVQLVWHPPGDPRRPKNGTHKKDGHQCGYDPTLRTVVEFAGALRHEYLSRRPGPRRSPGRRTGSGKGPWACDTDTECRSDTGSREWETSATEGR